MTTKQQASGQWKQIKGAVKEKYGQLTDDELSKVEGDRDQLIGLIQQKVGAARSEVVKFVSQVYESCGESCSSFAQQASEYAEATGQRLRQGYEQSTETVVRHPLESVVSALGIGVVIGIAIGYSLASDRSREPTWRERWTGR